MPKQTLRVRHRDGSTEELTYPIDRIAVCGLAGRDEEEVRAHVEELEEEGVDMPSEFPVAYPKPSHLVTTDDVIEVGNERTSGEAEFALFPAEDELYVAAASDHTDRELETEGIRVAKAASECVISEDVWPLSEIRNHWDTVELRSWTGHDGDPVLYQDGTVGSIVPPEEFLDIVSEKSGEPVENTLILTGTVSTETDEVIHGDFFASHLHDPVLNRTLSVEYDVKVVDWID